MTVIDEIAAERKRQIDEECNSHEHDDIEHANGDLARAAACYVLGGPVRKSRRSFIDGKRHESTLWPWDLTWWKPKDRRRDLIRAGALIVAEIERLDRAALKSLSNTEGTGNEKT